MGTSTLTAWLSSVLLLLQLLFPSAQAAEGDRVWIEGFDPYPQQRPMSCEIRSATDLARFWGLPLVEAEMTRLLPYSDDPNKGFVGSLDAAPGSLPPVGYGVYAAPIAQMLRRVGLNAQAHYGYTLEELKAEIAAGRPVIVWATYGMRLAPVILWKTSSGRAVPVVSHEHSFVALGYDTTGLYLADAYDAKIKYYSYETFLAAWEQIGRMAVTLDGPRSPTPGYTYRRLDYRHVFYHDQWDTGPW